MRKYITSGGAKCKDFGWTNTYKEVTTDTKGTEHSHRENFLNRNQILKLNALDPRDLGDEESDRLCAKLLKKSQVAYEFEPQTIPDDDKLLIMYKYIHFEGTAHKTVHNESKILGTEKDLSKSMIKDASSSNIKLEFPHHDQLKEATKPVRAYVSKLNSKNVELAKIRLLLLEIPATHKLRLHINLHFCFLFCVCVCVVSFSGVVQQSNRPIPAGCLDQVRGGTGC